MEPLFKDRIVEYPNRVKLTPVAGQSNVYDVSRQEGTITQDGTPLNAETLNLVFSIKNPQPPLFVREDRILPHPCTLSNYKEPGTYLVPYDTWEVTDKPAGASSAGKLTVYNLMGSGEPIVQIFQTIGSVQQVWTRRIWGSVGAWSKIVVGDYLESYKPGTVGDTLTIEGKFPSIRYASTGNAKRAVIQQVTADSSGTSFQYSDTDASSGAVGAVIKMPFTKDGILALKEDTFYKVDGFTVGWNYVQLGKWYMVIDQAEVDYGGDFSINGTNIQSAAPDNCRMFIINFTRQGSNGYLYYEVIAFGNTTKIGSGNVFNPRGGGTETGYPDYSNVAGVYVRIIVLILKGGQHNGYPLSR